LEHHDKQKLMRGSGKCQAAGVKCGFKIKEPDERDIIRLNLNLRTENLRF